LLLAAITAHAATLQVGPGKPYSKPCAAIAAAAPGDTIEIGATGDYTGDVCTWATDGLTLPGTGGRAKIDAAGSNSQGKAIWVIFGASASVTVSVMEPNEIIPRGMMPSRKAGRV
jgi:hypothetical protein